jgi:hypothetical protein
MPSWITYATWALLLAPWMPIAMAALLRLRRAGGLWRWVTAVGAGVNGLNALLYLPLLSPHIGLLRDASMAANVNIAANVTLGVAAWVFAGGLLAEALTSPSTAAHDTSVDESSGA